MNNIEIKFTYDKSEYINALNIYYRKRLRIPLDIIVSSLAISSGLLMIILNGFNVLNVTITILGFLLILIPIFALYIFPTLVYNGDSKIKDEYTLLFTDNNINFKTSKINSNIEWNFYTQVWESNKFYYLISNQRSISIIPKRAFSSMEDLSLFDEMILKHISKTIRQI